MGVFKVNFQTLEYFWGYHVEGTKFVITSPNSLLPLMSILWKTQKMKASFRGSTHFNIPKWELYVCVDMILVLFCIRVKDLIICPLYAVNWKCHLSAEFSTLIWNLSNQSWIYYMFIIPLLTNIPLYIYIPWWMFFRGETALIKRW